MVTGSAYLVAWAGLGPSSNSASNSLPLLAAAMTFLAVFGLAVILYVAVLFNRVVSQKSELERAFSNVDASCSKSVLTLCLT